MTVIEEDPKSCSEDDTLLEEIDVIGKIKEYIKTKDFYQEIAPLVQRLIHYKLSFKQEDYLKFYRSSFSEFYVVPQTNYISFIELLDKED